MTLERVLVVDDDAGLLSVMVLSLKHRGYDVEQALDGPGAIQILNERPPFSVLVTDLMMPGMTGIELLREARQIDDHLEVVVVTAAPDLETAITALRENGAYDYLLKPFESMSQLLLAIERAAAQRRLLIEREELRQEVQREAERLRALIANTGDAIFSADSRGVLNIVNPVAARLLGPEAVEGKDAIISLPPALATLISNWQAVGENLSAVIEMPWIDDTVQMVNLTPIPEAGPSHWGWVAVVRDITHIKRMGEVKSQVLVEVASRIRIPITQAMNALMELNSLTAQNKTANDVVVRLYQILKHIQEWGDDLNALIRIDSGIPVQVTAIDLEAVLNEVCQGQTGLQLENAEVHLEEHIEPHLPQVVADPDLIRRLLSGLISRAIERSQAGASVKLSARYHQEQVWVKVSDDGPSVDDTDLAHIFEKSFVKPGNGSSVTGLEMALVKTIIDHMGGQIWFGGQERKGSAIFVCLPALDGKLKP